MKTKTNHDFSTHSSGAMGNLCMRKPFKSNKKISIELDNSHLPSKGENDEICE